MARAGSKQTIIKDSYSQLTIHPARYRSGRHSLIHSSNSLQD